MLVVSNAEESGLDHADTTANDAPQKRCQLRAESCRVCVTILGGIRKAAHPSLSTSRRLLG